VYSRKARGLELKNTASFEGWWARDKRKAVL
jgi:hypothetical protein